MDVCEVDNERNSIIDNENDSSMNNLIDNSDIGSDDSNDDHLNNSALWSDDMKKICYGDLIMEKCEIMEKIELKVFGNNEVMQIIYCGVYKFISEDVRKIVDIYGFSDYYVLRLMRYGYVKYNSQEITSMILDNRFTKLNINEVIEIIEYGECVYDEIMQIIYSDVYKFSSDDVKKIVNTCKLGGSNILRLMKDGRVEYNQKELLRMILDCNYYFSSKEIVDKYFADNAIIKIAKSNEWNLTSKDIDKILLNDLLLSRDEVINFMLGDDVRFHKSDIIWIIIKRKCFTVGKIIRLFTSGKWKFVSGDIKTILTNSSIYNPIYDLICLDCVKMEKSDVVDIILCNAFSLDETMEIIKRFDFTPNEIKLAINKYINLYYIKRYLLLYENFDMIVDLIVSGYVEYNSWEIIDMIKNKRFHSDEVIDLIVSGKCGSNDDIRQIIRIEGLLSKFRIYGLIVNNYVEYKPSEIISMIKSKCFNSSRVMDLITSGKCGDDIREIINIKGLLSGSQICSLINGGYVKYKSSDIINMIKRGVFNDFEIMDLIESGKCGFNNDDIRGIIGIKDLLSGSQIYSLIVKDYVQYDSLDIISESSEIIDMIKGGVFNCFEVMDLIKCGKYGFNDNNIRGIIRIKGLLSGSQVYSLINGGYVKYESSEIIDMIKKSYFDVFEVMDLIISDKYGFNNDDIRAIICIKDLLSGFEIYSLINSGYVKYESSEIIDMIKRCVFNDFEVMDLIEYGKYGFSNDDIREIIDDKDLLSGSQIYSLMNNNYVECKSSKILSEIVEILSKITDASYDNDYYSSFHYSGNGNNNDSYVFIKEDESFMNKCDC